LPAAKRGRVPRGYRGLSAARRLLTRVQGFGDYIASASGTCIPEPEAEPEPEPEPEPEDPTPSASGYQSCTSPSFVVLRSYATGNVGHSVYGQTQGVWNN